MTTSREPPTTAAQGVAQAQSGRRRRTRAAKSARIDRGSPSLGDQILALATGKTQQEIAAACKGVRPNHSALRLPGTSGLAESRSATANSIPRVQQRWSNTPRFDATKKRRPVPIGAEEQSGSSSGTATEAVRIGAFRAGRWQRAQHVRSALSIRRISPGLMLTPSPTVYGFAASRRNSRCIALTRAR